MKKTTTLTIILLILLSLASIPIPAESEPLAISEQSLISELSPVSEPSPVSKPSPVSDLSEWQWVQIGELKEGDMLMDKEGREIEISSIEKKYDDKGVMVYDLDVEDDYYFADGVMVHNSGISGSPPQKETWDVTLDGKETIVVEVDKRSNKEDAINKALDLLKEQDSKLDTDTIKPYLTAKKRDTSKPDSTAVEYTASVVNPQTQKNEPLPLLVPKGKTPESVLEARLAFLNYNKREGEQYVQTANTQIEPTIPTTFHSIDRNNGKLYFGPNGEYEGSNPQSVGGSEYTVTINFRKYKVDTQTGKVILADLLAPNGKPIPLTEYNIREGVGAKVIYLTHNGAQTTANYDPTTQTYTISGTKEEVVYFDGKLIPTKLDLGDGNTGYYTPEYKIYTNDGSYAPVFTSNNLYYNKNKVLLNNFELSKNPIKLGDVMVSDRYLTDGDGKISPSSSGKRITQGTNFVDMSAEMYKEMGISETDTIKIPSINQLTKPTKEGGKTSLTISGGIETLTRTQQDTTTKISYNTADKSKATTTLNSKTKINSVEVISKDQHRLAYSYKTGSAPESATFTMADGRKTLIKTPSVTKAIMDEKISISNLELAREIEEGRAFFGMGKEQTDNNWEVEKDGGNSFLTIGETTIDLKNNRGYIKEGENFKIIYEASEGGYTYYQGEWRILAFILNNPLLAEGGEGSITQEFTKDTNLYGITFRKGDYVRTDYNENGENVDGSLIYREGKLWGVCVGEPNDCKAYQTKELFDEKGEFAPPDEIKEDNGVKFIGRKYTGKGKESFGVKLKSAYEAAQGGRALSTIINWKSIFEWRKAADNLFANNVLGQIISGKWEDSICHSQMPKDKSDLLNVRLPNGVITPGAFVTADIVSTIKYPVEKTAVKPDGTPVTKPDGTKVTYPAGTEFYLYKIGYMINNPRFAEKGKSSGNSYNLILYRQDGQIIKVFKKDKGVEEGEIIRGTPGTGEDSVPPKYSIHKYTKICLKFSKKLQTANGKFKDEVCSPITSKARAAEAYPGAESVVEGAGKEEEGNINDF